MTRLNAHGVALDTPTGRPLFRDLDLVLEPGERVALVGRNGVGKSSLLRVLAGGAPPAAGDLTCRGRRVLVPQLLTPDASRSPGEHRTALLAEALRARPDYLLLDEPTHDLDAHAIDWLFDALARYDGTLIVVSHDRRLLRTFQDYFVIAETGCHHVHGALDHLLAHLEGVRQRTERAYVRHLNRLTDTERHNDRLSRRRRRKKNLGRLHELRRCPSRAKLNGKRGYAQVSQGKRAVQQRDRIEGARAWARAARRALAVDLPLSVTIPPLPPPSEDATVDLQKVSARTGDGRLLFSDLSMRLDRERLAIVGPNGSGKSTLLEIIAGQRSPDSGRARADLTRIGYVAQEATNWSLAESLLEELVRTSNTPDIDTIARTLRAHRFPLGLAERPLSSLSPGERLRAALLCLLERHPTPELLVLDEPTAHLDLLGLAAVEALLARWPGGLLVATHDRELLDAIGVDQPTGGGLASIGGMNGVSPETK